MAVVQLLNRLSTAGQPLCFVLPAVFEGFYGFLCSCLRRNVQDSDIPGGLFRRVHKATLEIERKDGMMVLHSTP